MSRVPADALGPQLERLPGVLAATVFETPTASRVYLAIDPEADGEAVRATVLGVLRDHGHTTDPDAVHIGTAPPTPPVRSALPALTLDSLDVHRAEHRVECVVRLRTADRTPEARAVEPDSPAGRARAAARATLTAAEGLDPDLRLGLHGAIQGDLFGFDAVSVLVEASLGRMHAQLPGMALIEQSLEHAGALAALRALRSWSA